MKRLHALLCLVGLAGGVAAVIVVNQKPPPAEQPRAQKPADVPPGEQPPPAAPARHFPLPALTDTPHLNAAPGVGYIGSEACAKCHAKEHKSYLLTEHSRALSDLDPAAEPPDAAFEHRPSGRSYRVYRKEGKLWHEEVLRTAEGKEVGRVELPVRYLIGSGNFCRSYLVEVDGFLHESPLTWYTARKKWDMSPGYDMAAHWSFERPVWIGCVSCHSGRAEVAEGSAHRITFHEKAIGCENCHGPGAAHRDFHLANKSAPGARDLTIVHPGRLSRPLLESICASCHLSGAASVDVRGRTVADIRPGRPLSDYRVHYAFDGRREQMTVVGHVEQLRQSKCYQKSEMTCVTCHDPHARARPAEAEAYYRARCLDCHATKPCGLPAEQRLKQNPADNCAACHMPRGDTEIPHLAFTHHRIGKHGAQPPPESDRVPELVAVDDNPRLGELDRRRNLGLAYADLAGDAVHARHAPTYRARARGHLEAVYAAGMRDGPTLFALAVAAWEDGEPARAVAYATEAQRAPDLPHNGRAISNVILANGARGRGDFPAAVGFLQQTVRQRRFADDWRMLGVNYLDLNQPDKALEAFQKSLSIRPFRHTTHLGISDCYRRLGDAPRADDHRQKGEWLLRHKQD